MYITALRASTLMGIDGENMVIEWWSNGIEISWDLMGSNGDFFHDLMVIERWFSMVLVLIFHGDLTGAFKWALNLI